MGINREILLIEDEKVTMTLLKKRLENLGHTVHCVGWEKGGEDPHEKILELAKEKKIHIAICDLVLPDEEGDKTVLSGIGLVNEIRLMKKGIWIFINSGNVDVTAASRWKKLGVAEVFSKDNQDDFGDLLAAVQKYSEKPRKVKEKDI